MDKGHTRANQDPKGSLRVSFRTLTVLVTASLVALSVIVVSQVGERQLRRNLVAEGETQLMLETRNLALLSGDALLNDYPELTLVPLVIEIGQSRQGLEGIVVLNHDGRIAGHTDPRRVGEVWTAPEDSSRIVARSFLQPGEILRLGPDRLRAQAPVTHSTEGEIGTVVISLDRALMEGRIREARRSLATVAVVLLVLSIGLVTVMLTVLFRPVKSLEAGLVRIGLGDLDTPLPVRGASELSRLAETLNEMAAQLKASRALAEAREEEIIETQREVITTLGDVVEGRSRETANHTRRVGIMSRELALLIGLDEEEADLLRLASPMHDVGKIGIPDSILNKPGKFTAEERAVMETHATMGYEILKGSNRPIMQAAAIIAREHHERWDGAGYPNRIAGPDIHIYGRITALVDVFDALVSDRVYRPAMPLEKVLGIIREGRGTHFDPDLVDLFMDNLKRFLAISERYQDAPGERPLGAPVDHPVPVTS